MITHFRRDQAGYDAWRAEHADSGYVISWDDREAEVAVARPTEPRLVS